MIVVNFLMPNGDFTCSKGINANFNQPYDFASSVSVFYHFKDLDYAKDIAIKTIQNRIKSWYI